MSTTLQNLIARRADLDAQIAVTKAADFHAAVQAAVDLFANARVPLDEAAAALLTLHNKSTRPRRTKGAPKYRHLPTGAKYRHLPTGAKYRHLPTGAMWTGRGKQPKWFAEAGPSEIEYIGGGLA